MKLQAISLSLLATTALVTGINAANARSTSPGLYVIDGGQELCLLSNGTWFSPTFSGWGGTWENVSGAKFAKTVVRGNYALGAGNDSITIKRSIAGWDEWRDSESFQTYLDPVTWSSAGSCSTATRHNPPRANKANPAQ